MNSRSAIINSNRPPFKVLRAVVKHLPLIILMLVGSQADADAVPLSACLSLTGSIHIVETPGPPNYGESATDSRMQFWVLTLESPLRVKVRDDLGREQEVDELTEVQIIGSHITARIISTGHSPHEMSGCRYFAEAAHHVTKGFLDVNFSK
jgi:hypothetical protein